MISPTPRRQRRVDVVRRDQRLLQVLVHHRARRVRLERRAAGDDVIHRRAERVDVGAEVDVHVAADLLGADVVRRAVRLAGLGLGGFLVVRLRAPDPGRSASRRPAGVSMMFFGFTSRWISPRRWAWARASAIWIMMSSASASLKRAAFAVGRRLHHVVERLALDVLHDEVVIALGRASRRRSPGRCCCATAGPRRVLPCRSGRRTRCCRSCAWAGP